MDCDAFRTRLDAYMDGELDRETAAAAGQHVEACEACRRALGRQRLLSAAVKAGARYHRAPAALRTRLIASLDEPADTAATAVQPRVVDLPAAAAEAPPPPRARRSFAARHLMAMAASFALGIAITSGASMYSRQDAMERDLLRQELVASHVRSLMPGHLTDVASSDQHTVRPWFAGKLDFAPPVADLADAGFPLIGGRLDYIGNRPVAALSYRRNQHLINLYVWPDPAAAGDTAPTLVTRNGFNIEHWTDPGWTYWAVSDVNAAELRQLRDAVRRSAEPDTAPHRKS